MGRHIMITVYFADEGLQHDLASPEIAEHLDTHLERPFFRQPYEEMEKRRADAMEDIDFYMYLWNDFEAYTILNEARSECAITLPKKADLDAGLLALVYHLFERGQITGFTVMHTGA